MFLWLITGELVSIGRFVVPCLTTENSLSEIEDHIQSHGVYCKMTITKIEAIGGMQGTPGLGTFISLR